MCKFICHITYTIDFGFSELSAKYKLSTFFDTPGTARLQTFTVLLDVHIYYLHYVQLYEHIQSHIVIR